MKSNDNVTGCLLIVAAVLFIALFYVIVVFALQWGWNMSMPAIFDLPSITPEQAFGLTVLLSVLRLFTIPVASAKKG